MPEHEKHCQDSFRKYGKRFDELHTWMDEPWEILGTHHRMYRHDPYTTPKEARELFGEYAHHACLDHIILDWRDSPVRFDSVFKQHPRRGLPAGICPRCNSVLVWRRAQLTGELYRGCTNYLGGCRYQERSYKRTPARLKRRVREIDFEQPNEYPSELLDYYDDGLLGPDEGHFYEPLLKGKAQIDEHASDKVFMQEKSAELRRKETEAIVACIVGFVLFLAGLMIQPLTSLFQQPSGISALPGLIFMISGFAIMLSTAAYSHHYSNERKKLMKKLE